MHRLRPCRLPSAPPAIKINRPALELFPEMLVPPQLPALVPSQQADDVVLDAGGRDIRRDNRRNCDRSIIEFGRRMSGPIHLRARYRPIRIGWCIQAGDFEEYRKALRLTHTMWGGRFNPVIPLGDPELARALVKAFRLDCLYFISDSQEGRALDTEFSHLLWPGFDRKLFKEGMRGPLASFLDVYHPARHFYDNNIKDRKDAPFKGTLLKWDPADQLADIFLASFGAYPDHEEIGLDYAALIKGLLGDQEFEIVKDAVISPDLLPDDPGFGCPYLAEPDL